MNALQFFYVHTVLGVSSVIRPKVLRSSYRLHHNASVKPDFLFFSSQIKAVEEKTMIQKIAKSIGSSQHLIVEILSNNSQPILDNLLTRFLPNGFVIFGSELVVGSELVDYSTGKIIREVFLSEQSALPIPGCVLSSISDFVGSDSSEIQKTKQKAWNLLRQSFLPLS